jgi:hypothetical protein
MPQSDSSRFHAVSTAGAGLFGGFDRCRRTAGGSLVDDDLTQVLADDASLDGDQSSGATRSEPS